MTVGEKIAYIIRNFEENSKTKFAIKIGTPGGKPGLIGDWVCGKSKPGHEYRVKICEAYAEHGVTAEWLNSTKDAPPPPVSAVTAQGCGYDPWMLIYYNMKATHITEGEHIAAGHGEKSFWNSLRRKEISYKDMEMLRGLFCHDKINEDTFFACCGVNPLFVIDDKGAVDILTIKLFHEILSLVGTGGAYVSKSRTTAYNEDEKGKSESLAS